jgi:5-methylcytosine-specific restriction endonuclease McrA
MIAPFTKTSRLIDKTAKKRAKEQQWRDVCRQVDARDGGFCRACRRRTVITMSQIESRREHHHVVPRSLGGKDEVSNIATLCLSCHSDRHITRILTIVGRADQALSFEKDGQTWQG